jgi:hypothetical protein
MHKGGVSSPSWQMSRGYSHDSLQDSTNLLYLKRDHELLISVLANKNGRIDVYNQYLQFCSLISRDAWPTIVDAPLALIFKLGQGANLSLF